jgi:hypothetical protein
MGVYAIENLVNGKYYIGRRSMWLAWGLPRVLSRLLPEVPEPLGVHLRVALRVLDVHLAQVLLTVRVLVPASRGVLSKR